MRANNAFPRADEANWLTRKAEPLLAELKKDPNNAKLLLQIGNVYKATHQFKEAAGYCQHSLKIDPNAEIRTEMATCLYYSGDVDGALTGLQRSLEDKPKDANSLFNLGMIKWRGKSDAHGAVAAWRRLLESNPNLEKKPGTISVEAGQRDGSAVVIVSDTGRGISHEHLPNIFPPFYTTKGNGTGLVVSLARRIVEDHHGPIRGNQFSRPRQQLCGPSAPAEIY